MIYKKIKWKISNKSHENECVYASTIIGYIYIYEYEHEYRVSYECFDTCSKFNIEDFSFGRSTLDEAKQDAEKIIYKFYKEIIDKMVECDD